MNAGPDYRSQVDAPELPAGADPFLLAAHAGADVALPALLDRILQATGAAAAAVLAPCGVVRAAAGCVEAEVASWGPCADVLCHPLEALGAAAGHLSLRFPAGLPAGAQPPPVPLLTLLAFLLETERLYEEAREARQEREHFLVALHHEVRTPATVLVLDADALRSGLFGPVSAEAEPVLERIEEQALALANILDQVAELGKLAARANPAHLDMVQPRDLVRQALLQAEPLARRKGLRLVLRAPAYLAPIQTDGVRLLRALAQLLSNAIRFSAAEGEVAVSLSYRSAARRRDAALEITVADRGEGIAPDQLDRILEPFGQVAEGARSNSAERGTGLGLALARRLVQSLGGDLHIESVLGLGTRATLRVPYASW